MDLEKIESIIRPLVESSGFKLYNIEFQGRTLRVFIEKQEGVGVDDCAIVSRMLNPVLDVEDVVPGGSYELEVSSPGLNRRLMKREHFTNAVGVEIFVNTTEPMSAWNGADPFFANRKKISAKLVAFDGETLTLSSQGHEGIKIPFRSVAKAQVEFELKPTPKKGKRE